MTAFPSGSINTEHLDSAVDSPSDARADLLTAIQKLNAIIASIDSNFGVASLNSSGKVKSSQMDLDSNDLADNCITTNSLQSNCITNDKIKDNEITFTKTTGIVDNSTTLGGASASDNKVATQNAIKTYFLAQGSALPEANLSTTSNTLDTVSTGYSSTYETVSGSTNLIKIKEGGFYGIILYKTSGVIEVEFEEEGWFCKTNINATWANSYSSVMRKKLKLESSDDRLTAFVAIGANTTVKLISTGGTSNATAKITQIIKEF
tara:strand:- start:2199 stop:2987 length:789 start_codon:yes stop_codon:yes gene_type:complete